MPSTWRGNQEQRDDRKRGGDAEADAPVHAEVLEHAARDQRERDPEARDPPKRPISRTPADRAREHGAEHEHQAQPDAGEKAADAEAGEGGAERHDRVAGDRQQTGEAHRAGLAEAPGQRRGKQHRRSRSRRRRRSPRAGPTSVSETSNSAEIALTTGPTIPPDQAIAIPKSRPAAFAWGKGEADSSGAAASPRSGVATWARARGGSRSRSDKAAAPSEIIGV